jgi:hypothetical protein
MSWGYGPDETGSDWERGPRFLKMESVGVATGVGLLLRNLEESSEM